MKRLGPWLFTLVVLGAAPLGLGAEGRDWAPAAASAVLVDQASGRVLWQKDPERSIPPASLTKLMTLHLAWKALASGQVQAWQVVPITEATAASAAPRGSSLMFLEPGQRVTVRELMEGLAVDSGNDTGLTLAQHLAGSQSAFVEAMNTEARTLGLGATEFFDSYGFDPRNRTTASDFARFCRYYLAAHPQAVTVLHNLRSFTYPQAANLPPGARPTNPITQANRNTLLGLYPGADGLKTGFIEASGYNLAATAQRQGQRLVVVLLGVSGRDAAEGSRLRAEAAMRLFDLGFSTYPLTALPPLDAPAVRVWFSQPGTVVPTAAASTVCP